VASGSEHAARDRAREPAAPGVIAGRRRACR
jgi:hypothetical protein